MTNLLPEDRPLTSQGIALVCWSLLSCPLLEHSRSSPLPVPRLYPSLLGHRCIMTGLDGNMVRYTKSIQGQVCSVISLQEREFCSGNSNAQHSDGTAEEMDFVYLTIFPSNPVIMQLYRLGLLVASFVSSIGAQSIFSPALAPLSLCRKGNFALGTQMPSTLTGRLKKGTGVVLS
jgi:hypothetical protein